MAKGDTISDIAAVAASASLTFQPSAGVEVILVEISTHSGINDLAVRLYDGSLYCQIGPASSRWQGKLFLTNGHYLDLVNTNAATQNLSYIGVQVK